MNFKERMNAVLHHEKPDKVPFGPYGIFVPQGEFCRTLRNKGMGMLVGCSAIWSEMPNVSVETRTQGDLLAITYRTPVGSVSTKYKTHISRGIRWRRSLIQEYMIKDAADFDPVIYMVEDTVFHAEHDVYYDLARDLGGDGIIRQGGISAPYDEAYGYLGLEKWAIAQYRYPTQFERLLGALQKRTERFLPFLLDCPTEFVACGSINGFYGPRQYEKYTLPFYQKYMPVLHAKGKIVSCHAHWPELSKVKDLIPKTGLDVIEAFTPPPIGDLSVAEARAAWGGDIIIWVNFPEYVFSRGAEETKKYTVDLLRSDAPGDHLAIGMTEVGLSGVIDDETERVFHTGMMAIVDAINEYGVYPISKA